MKKLLFCAILSSIGIAYCPAQIIQTIAGNYLSGGGYSGDGGAATLAEIANPWGLTVDAVGNLYIADVVDNVIRKVNTSGIISTVAGNFSMGSGFSGDGGAATSAELWFPSSVVFDSIGNMFIADYYNCVIRKVNTSGIISTIAGIGHGCGYSGDGGSATDAELNSPASVVFDHIGNLFISDRFNYVIRKINSAGIISTVAGNHNAGAGYGGDGGPATLAELDQAVGISFDGDGNLYIADYGNYLVRKVNTAGIISTVAGNYSYGSGYSGDGGPATLAELYQPIGVFANNRGDFYIADNFNAVIRKVTSAGTISTIAGNHISSYSGDGGPATDAELSFPDGLTFDASMNLYISDNANHLIRKVTGLTSDIPSLSTLQTSLSIFPNPAQNEIYVQVQGNTKAEFIELYNITGQVVLEQKPNSQYSILNITNIDNGLYFLKVKLQDGGEVVKKVEVIK